MGLLSGMVGIAEDDLVDVVVQGRGGLAGSEDGSKETPLTGAAGGCIATSPRPGGGGESIPSLSALALDTLDSLLLTLHMAVSRLTPRRPRPSASSICCT